MANRSHLDIKWNVFFIDVQINIKADYMTTPIEERACVVLSGYNVCN